MNKQEAQVELGRRIVSERIRQHITQEELAKRLRAGRSNISLVESGKSQITVWRLLQIAAALHVSPGVLLGAEYDHVPRPYEQNRIAAQSGDEA